MYMYPGFKGSASVHGICALWRRLSYMYTHALWYKYACTLLHGDDARRHLLYHRNGVHCALHLKIPPKHQFLFAVSTTKWLFEKHWLSAKVMSSRTDLPCPFSEVSFDKISASLASPKTRLLHTVAVEAFYDCFGINFGCISCTIVKPCSI